MATAKSTSPRKAAPRKSAATKKATADKAGDHNASAKVDLVSDPAVTRAKQTAEFTAEPLKISPADQAASDVGTGGEGGEMSATVEVVTVDRRASDTTRADIDGKKVLQAGSAIVDRVVSETRAIMAEADKTSVVVNNDGTPSDTTEDSGTPAKGKGADSRPFHLDNR